MERVIVSTLLLALPCHVPAIKWADGRAYNPAEPVSKSGLAGATVVAVEMCYAGGWCPCEDGPNGPVGGALKDIYQALETMGNFSFERHVGYDKVCEC